MILHFKKNKCQKNNYLHLKNLYTNQIIENLELNIYYSKCTIQQINMYYKVDETPLNSNSCNILELFLPSVTLFCIFKIH